MVSDLLMSSGNKLKQQSLLPDNLQHPVRHETHKGCTAIALRSERPPVQKADIGLDTGRPRNVPRYQQKKAPSLINIREGAKYEAKRMLMPLPLFYRMVELSGIEPLTS